MNNLSNKKLSVILVLLVALFLLSFTGIFKAESRRTVKTALLNPKYKDELFSIELTHGTDAVFLEKKDGIWRVKHNSLNFYTVTAQNRVEDFINELIKVVTLYKISDNLSEKNAFGLNSDKTFRIKCSYGSSFSEYFLGNQDFTRSYRYLMTGKNTKVYQIGDEIEKYLTVSLLFWTEPELISKSLVQGLSANSVQRVEIQEFSSGVVSAAKILTPLSTDFSEYVNSLLDLRHGGIFDSGNPEGGERVLSLTLETGDKNQIFLDAFATNDEGVFALKVFYKEYDFTATLKISAWTLLKLKGSQK